MLFSGKHHVRKDAIGGIVNAPLNAYLEPHMATALEVLKHFVSQYVIQIPEVQRFEYKGQQIIMDMFEALAADPERLLPSATKEKWLNAEQTSGDGLRVICDYISAMTDAYAHSLLART